MGSKTGIQWTDHTWNPWRGCRKISAGCQNCYMYRDQLRYGRDPRAIVRAAEKTFRAPTKWKTPARVFTCSWADFFIEDADNWRPAAWEIIRETPWLTYQILTKRIENVRDRLPEDWPLSNVWLGVTAENQHWADIRIPQLASIPAAGRFVSAEPLLGPIDFRLRSRTVIAECPVDWIVSGGESGPNARVVPESCFLDIMDQCDDVGIPFFFKQWGGTKKINGVWGGNELNGKTYMGIPINSFAPPWGDK